MSEQFEWHVDEDEYDNIVRSRPPRSPRRSWRYFMVIAVILIVGIGWRVSQHQLQRLEARIKQDIQAILTLEHQAFLAGDGELFFSVQVNDDAWRTAQLLPENQAVSRAGLQVTQIFPQDENIIWADVTWYEAGQIWRRIAFFKQDGAQFVHLATDPAYWGTTQSLQRVWGQLIYYEADEVWATQILDFVDEIIAGTCQEACQQEKLPLTIHLTNDYNQTAVAGQLHVPSPRIFALDEAGEPAPHFWATVEQRVTNYLHPITLRFAVTSTIDLIDYQRVAKEFMFNNPGIMIEIVTISDEDMDPVTLLHEFDGATLTPSVELVTAGHIYDLTNFVQTDADFNTYDFYEQIWRGAWWQDRLWFMPQAAKMHLLFYDRETYQNAEQAEPSLCWTWDEVEADIRTLVADQPQQNHLSWGLLDINNNTLLSYAYNWNNECRQEATVLCQHPLNTDNVAAALAWYQYMVTTPHHMPDLTMMTPAERANVIPNWQSARRRAAIWVEDPINYEHNLLLDGIGIVPFPGSDRFDGITPLWVQGSVISQYSEHPQAMWQWLKFLSHQPPSPGSRLIPPRPSDAIMTRYWSTLPRPLADAMRIAFPFARPVTIEEKAFFSWEQLAAVASGKLSPATAAQQQPNFVWFTATLPEEQSSE